MTMKPVMNGAPQCRYLRRRPSAVEMVRIKAIGTRTKNDGTGDITGARSCAHERVGACLAQMPLSEEERK